MNNWSEPLLAARRAITRASELAAERRLHEAHAHLASSRRCILDAERIIWAILELEKAEERRG
jgi:hypothetical protein